MNYLEGREEGVSLMTICGWITQQSQTNQWSGNVMQTKVQFKDCLLLREADRAALVGSNPSSPRLTTFCFAEKVLLPCFKKAGRCG
jgi:hypothetical protein